MRGAHGRPQRVGPRRETRSAAHARLLLLLRKGDAVDVEARRLHVATHDQQHRLRRLSIPGIEAGPLLAALALVSPRGLGPIAPGHCAEAGEAIAHAGALGFGIKAGGADAAPAVQHNGTPNFLGFDIEADHVAPPALITNGRNHRLAVEVRYARLNQNPRLALTSRQRRRRRAANEIAATLVGAANT